MPTSKKRSSRSSASPKTDLSTPPWTYRGEAITDEITAGFESFVYMITRKSTGRRYLGKKILNRRTSKPPLAGKKRRRRTVTKSDWETYWGSNTTLNAEIEAEGTADFEREILRLCRTRGEASYWEAKLQFQLEVLEHPEKFYNEYIQIRVHRSHLRKGSISS